MKELESTLFKKIDYKICEKAQLIICFNLRVLRGLKPNFRTKFKPRLQNTKIMAKIVM